MVMYGDSITWRASLNPRVWDDYFGSMGGPSAPLGVIFNAVSDLAYRITSGDELFTLPPKVVVSRPAAGTCVADLQMLPPYACGGRGAAPAGVLQPRTPAGCDAGNFWPPRLPEASPTAQPLSHNTPRRFCLSV